MDLPLEGVDLGLVGDLVAGLLDVLEQIGASTAETLVTEAPVVGLLGLSASIDADGFILHLAESVKIELADEGAKVVVFEVPWNDGRCECIGILDNKSGAVLAPFANFAWAIVDH